MATTPKHHLQAVILLDGALMLRPLCDNASAAPLFTTDRQHADLCGACRNRLPYRMRTPAETADCAHRVANIAIAAVHAGSAE